MAQDRRSGQSRRLADGFWSTHSLRRILLLLLWRRPPRAYRAQFLVEGLDRPLEGPWLALPAFPEAAFGPAGLTVVAGEEPHDAVELRALVGPPITLKLRCQFTKYT